MSQAPSTIPADGLTPLGPLSVGRYQVIGRLGQGGMADVLLSVLRGDLGFQKLVVLKRMHPNLAADEHFVKMFVDEARLAARLNHPHVVQTMEVGEADGAYFIAMQYLEGQSLDRVMRRYLLQDRALPLSFLLRVLCECLEGLHYAHELRDFDGSALDVVHRDATPSNLFVTYDGAAKVLDFGIAKAASQDHATRTGVLKGKLAYMSPEQFFNAPIDRRADVWSMGVVCWELATGRRLFKGNNEVDTYKNIMSAPVPPLAAYRPDAPPGLDAVIARALARRRDDRYPTAEALRVDLDAVLRDHAGAVPRSAIATEMKTLFGSTIEENRRAIQQYLRPGPHHEGPPLGLSSVGALRPGAGHTLPPSATALDARALGLAPPKPVAPAPVRPLPPSPPPGAVPPTIPVDRPPTAPTPTPTGTRVLAPAPAVKVRLAPATSARDEASLDLAEPTVVTGPSSLVQDLGVTERDILAPPALPEPEPEPVAAAEPPPAFDPIPAEVEDSPAAARRKWWRRADAVIGWCILLALVGGVGAVAWSRRAWIASAARGFAAERADDPMTRGAFRLRVVTVPSGAHVYEGREDLGLTPFELVIHRASIAERPRTLVLRLPGYRDVTLPVANATDDVVRRVTLAPAAGLAGLEERPAPARPPAVPAAAPRAPHRAARGR